MKFTIKRQDIDGQLEIERFFWSGQIKACLAGKPLERVKEKGFPFIVPMKNGKNCKLIIKTGWLDPVPRLYLDQEEIRLAEPLRPIDYIFACFPVLMFLAYGPLATVLAFFLLMANFRILRSKSKPSLKWTSIYALNIVSFWLIIAIARFAWSNSN